MYKKSKTLNKNNLIIVWVLFLPLFIPLITGCSTVSTMKKATNKIVRDFKAPDGDLIKRVGIAFFENKTAFAGKGLEESFVKDLTVTIKSSCRDALLVMPGDPGYPDYLVKLPRQTSGWIDNFELAKTGRQLGFNAIVAGAIIDIGKNKEEKGFWWFKDIHHFIQVQIMVEVYDTQTGAKLLDESYLHEIEVEETDLESTNLANEIRSDIINEAFKDIAADMGEQICDAIVMQPWKGYVTSINEEKVVISSGKKVGITPGDIFEVYDSNGVFQGAEDQKFFIPGLKIGEIKITAVYPDSAEAVCSSGQNIQPGSSISPKD